MSITKITKITTIVMVITGHKTNCLKFKMSCLTNKYIETCRFCPLGTGSEINFQSSTMKTVMHFTIFEKLYFSFHHIFTRCYQTFEKKMF